MSSYGRRGGGKINRYTQIQTLEGIFPLRTMLNHNSKGNKNKKTPNTTMSSHPRARIMNHHSTVPSPFSPKIK